jgi:DNA repair exonuclease SbcCD ATPase subunit
MDGARVTGIRLNYGNLRDATHEIPQEDRPVVISGPNGSGKTTLLEAIVRTLFGFNRRSEAGLLEARLETLESGWCELRVRTPEGAHLDIRRDFHDARAVITTVETQEERFKGDANPAGTNEQSRAFREEVRALMGLADYEDFSKTTFVEQGVLINGALSEELLRVASGGSGGVEEAQKTLETRYFELTKEALPGQSRGKNKNRRLEELRHRRHELDEALQETAAQERQRTPLATRIGELETEIAGLDERIGALETAQGGVQSQRARAAEEKIAKDSTEDAKRARDRISEARTAEESARADFGARGVGCGPEQVEAEATALRQVLESLREAHRQQQAAETAAEAATPALPAGSAGVPAGVWVAGAVGAITAVLAVVLGRPVLWAVAAGALAVAGGQYVAHRSRVAAAVRAAQEVAAKAEAARADERKKREAEVTSAREAVTERARVLGLAESEPDQMQPALEAIEKDARALLEAQRRLEERTQEAADLLVKLRDAMKDAAPSASGDVIEALRVCEEHFRKEQVRLEMEGEGAAVELPAGVEATTESVKSELEEARRQRGAKEQERRQQQEALLTRATPDASSVALRDELEQVSEEISRVEARVRSLGFALELLGEAYDEFRDGDEGRLLERVSERATGLSDGQIGPVEPGETLDAARITVLGRRVAFDSPGLSYGERVAIGLALRLGATDFLARNGIRPPLLIDEPFDDLDPERAAGVWKLLTDIARERQVIVTSQNPLTLEHLGIEPDIRLTGRGLNG